MSNASLLMGNGWVDFQRESIRCRAASCLLKSRSAKKKSLLPGEQINRGEYRRGGDRVFGALDFADFVG